MSQNTVSVEGLRHRIAVVFASNRRPNHHHRDELSLLNGRWGTCPGCPRDGRGFPYPERCAFSDRYDHNIPIGND